MNVSLLAGRYAKALFELALEKGAMEEVHRDSRLIEKICDESRDFRLMLKSPILDSGKKLAVVRSLFAGKIHELTLNYLLIMIRKKREPFIPAIAHHLTELYQEYHNILTVRFLSPAEPDEATRRQVLQLMENYTHAGIDLRSEIDDTLVGGFVLKWQDKQYDASIRRKIENIRSKIAKVNLYKKGF
ncbi:MAG TPA: ATP synthase F1 subunit delta [Bacteroidales bacterium]|nr:ATP synthase F1 subunit delta [Bacteroidales bacterium]HPS61430.1 ATP synthase F1 subunit delta [Bacteroidales bacterium]